MFGNAHAVARCTLSSFVVCGEPRWGGGCSNNTFHLGLECGNENIRMQAYWNAIVCWINVWLAAIVWGISRFSPSSNFVRKTLRRPRFYKLCKAKISYYSDGCGVPHKETKAERGGSSEFMKLIKLSCSDVMWARLGRPAFVWKNNRRVYSVACQSLTPDRNQRRTFACSNIITDKTSHAAKSLPCVCFCHFRGAHKSCFRFSPPLLTHPVSWGKGMSSRLPLWDQK